MVLLLTLAALLAGAQGAATDPPRTDAEPILASPAVIAELRATRPAFAALSAADQAVTHLWLHTSCGVGSDDLRARFVAVGPRAEAALLEAFRLGPPAAFLAEQAAVRRRDHAAIQAGLADDENTFLTPDVRQRLAAVSEEDYVKAGVAQAVERYQVAALDGLALVGSDAARAWLQEAAPGLASPAVRRAAERTLAALGDRPRR